MLSVVKAFVVGGLICVLGQLILEYSTLTPAHIMVLFTVLGGILGGLGWYGPLLEFAGAGAFIPVSSFGNTMVRGAVQGAQTAGLLGLFKGCLEYTGTGIIAAVVFGSIAALLVNPRR